MDISLHNFSAELDLHEITRQFSQTGFVVLRNALEKNRVLSLQERLHKEFKRLTLNIENLDEDCQKNLRRNEMPVHPEIARFRLDPFNYEHLTASKSFAMAIRHLCGEDFAWHYPTMFRSLHSQDTHGLLPYHQDFFYNSRYPKMIVCWIPLDPCGLEAPSLELVGRKMTHCLPHESKGPWEFGIAQDVAADYIKPDIIYRPILDPGDVVVFDELTLHRSYASTKMTKSRMSMDARAIPLSSINSNESKNRNFIRSDKPELVRFQI